MSDKIKIGFQDDLFRSDISKFERANYLLKSIDIEFKKIDRPIDKVKLLKAEDVEGFIIKHYWDYAEALLPKGTTPSKALSFTDFDLKNVVSYVCELRTLSDVFLLKGLDIVSKVNQESYHIYVSQEKEAEFKIITSIIENLMQLENTFGWEWNLQKVLGFGKISIENQQPKPNIDYFSI